jgi:hypothetical protein
MLERSYKARALSARARRRAALEAARRTQRRDESPSYNQTQNLNFNYLII